MPGRLAAAIGAVPNATAILDTLNGDVPGNTDLARMVLASLKVTGHGFLSYQRAGANTVPQLADEMGVYSDVIYRVIDDEPGAANIALSLEQAVQDARNNGAMIVVGHVRQETVTSLFQWLLGADPRDITIAPISVVLR